MVSAAAASTTTALTAMASGPASSPARSGDWPRPACSSSVECVMDDVVEPAAGEMLLPKVLAELADPALV